MTTIEPILTSIQGTFCDVLRDPQGNVLWTSGLRKNTIVVDCRKLLAGFMLGAPNTLGIQGLQVGMGDPNWDAMSGPPAPQPTDVTLTDPNPHLVPLADLDLKFLEVVSDAPSVVPTNRIQIRATIGPNVPPWPDANHPTSTLREFGLAARLNGTNVLVNHVRHIAIAKDPTSTLERTIWIVF